MTQKLTSEEMMNRYVQEVARRLPAKQRSDVARELGSLLRETLEGELPPGEPGVHRTAAVLREFGPPEAVARRYQGRPAYLIGPRAFPTFLLTLKAVLGGSFGLAALITAVRAIFGDLDDPLSAAGMLLGIFWQLTFTLSAVAVLVFSIVERLAPEELPDPDDQNWDPYSLPAVEKSSEISVFEVYFNLYATVVLLIWFNLFPDWVGVFLGPGPDGLGFVSLSEMGFHLPLLLVSLWWVASIVKNVWLLRKGRWTASTRWFEFFLGVGAVIILALILGDALSVVQSEPFRGALAHPKLVQILSKGIVVALGAGVAVVSGVSIVRLHRLVRNRRSPEATAEC